MSFSRELGKPEQHLFNVWSALREADTLPLKKAIGIRELNHFASHYAILHLNDQGPDSYFAFWYRL